MASINLDNDALASIASAAIFDSLSESARADILTQAVQYLITPVKNPNGYGAASASPLQEAFQRSLQQAAYKAVEEKIKDDPIVSKQIEDLLGPLVNGALESEAENWNTSLSQEIGKAVGNWLNAKAREARS